jgi:hypothetical protein
MERKTHILLSLVVFSIYLSIIGIYWRSIVQKDFYIIESDVAAIDETDSL